MTSFRCAGPAVALFAGVAWWCALFLCLPHARAQLAPVPEATASEVADGPPYEISLERHITLGPDLVSVVVNRARLKVLREVAIRSLGQQIVNFIDGMQTLDIVEAYTEKRDGRRLDVEPHNILTRDAASGAQAVYLRDAKVKTIIFPDLQVGDSIVYATRVETRERMFPGHYYSQDVFSRALPFKHVSVTLEAPAEVKLHIEKVGAGLLHQEATGGDKRVHHFRYTAPNWVQEVPGSVSIMDREPRVFISTFPDYQAVGRAYWAGAADKGAQTAEIKSLAEEITKGIDGRLAQARAIDNWVKRNIRYVAVYLGQGRFVPNSAAAVLKNRYGDCKDQAIVMGALLEAKGIRSEHALIQLGNSYRLPDVAMPVALNHVILYLPDLEVFADPTLSNGSFGVLAEQAYDKPIVLASATSVRLSRTPPLKPEAHSTINRSRIKIAVDGTVTGTTEQIATGFWASGVRAFAINLQSVGRERAAENILNAQRTPGKGTIETAVAYDNSEPVTIRGTFTINEKLGLPLQGLQPHADRPVIPVPAERLPFRPAPHRPHAPVRVLRRSPDRGDRYRVRRWTSVAAPPQRRCDRDQAVPFRAQLRSHRSRPEGPARVRLTRARSGVRSCCRDSDCGAIEADRRHSRHAAQLRARRGQGGEPEAGQEVDRPKHRGDRTAQRLTWPARTF